MNYRLLINSICAALIVAFGTTSCNAGRFYNETYSDPQRLELGSFQKEIYEGMSQEQLACVLGAPNIVTTDQNNHEAWIYDKIATEVRQSGSSGLILFCQTGADYVSRKDVSQKTLTVVIKFDAQKQVSSFSYHSSKF